MGLSVIVPTHSIFKIPPPLTTTCKNSNNTKRKLTKIKADNSDNNGFALAVQHTIEILNSTTSGLKHAKVVQQIR